MVMSDFPESYGVLYQFAPEYDENVPDDTTAAIRILEPKYKGVVIRYNTVKFIEDPVSNNLKLSFNYEIVFGEVAASDIPNFVNILGDLLYDLMLVKIQLDSGD